MLKIPELYEFVDKKRVLTLDVYTSNYIQDI